MKSLLKLFGALALVTTPVVTVIACSDDVIVNPRDIQSSALALMRDSEFKMTDIGIANTEDLNKLSGKNFKGFSDEIKKRISTIFSNQLKKSTNERPTQWYYDDASVVVGNGSDASDANFQIPVVMGDLLVDGFINGHLSVNVSVTYKNLPAISKDIKLTFNNDITKKQQKTDAMQKFIEKKINTDDYFIKNSVDVATLPTTDETVDTVAAETNLNTSIVPNLRIAIKKLIQYQDLTVNIEPYYEKSNKDTKKLTSTSFFTIGTPTGSDKLTFNGTLKNVEINFNINGANSHFKIDDNKIKVTQTETNAVNQISGAFSAHEQTVATLPKPTDKVTNVTDLEKNIKNLAEDSIKKSYLDITADEINITNSDAATFTGTDDWTGYFILNFKVSHKYKEKEFVATAQNIKVTVTVPKPTKS